MRFAVDAGHGGTDPGAKGEGVSEASVTLENAFSLRRELQSQGHSVVMTRVADIYVPLKNRCQIANEKRADYFISLHCNADADDDTDPKREAKGIEVWYYAPSARSLKLATVVRDALHAEYPEYTRCEVKSTEVLYVLKRTNMPSILIEMGFIDSPTDRARMVAPEQAKRFQHTVAAALCAFVLPSK